MLAAGLASALNASAATYYVSAQAPANGNGSMARPFSSLEAVERASGAGDAIIVLPSASTVAPLDGGIELKPHQRLIGGGPAVIGREPNADAPRIANTSDARLAGDAVRLADGTLVSNLVIVTARRSGVYGRGARDARVESNDISDANTSCSAGLEIFFPAQSPWQPRQNGFAAIMLDFDSGPTNLDINDNFIHDSSCSDGIDVRAGGNAVIVGTIDGNVITRLKQGPAVGSLLGIGLQTRDRASLIVASSHNALTYLGNSFEKLAAGDADEARPTDPAGADCQGLSTSQTGGTIVWNIDRNTFAHGIGSRSCAGAAFQVGKGAADLHAVVRDSIFEDNPGDMIEENNLGSDSSMDLRFDNVIVRHASHAGSQLRELALPPLSSASFTDRGVCLSQFSVGPRATTRFAMTRSHFSACAGDGILALHANWPGPGVGAGIGAVSAVEIDQSSILDVGDYAVHFINYSPLEDLQIKVQSSRLEGAPGVAAVAADSSPAGHVNGAQIDLGGGTLGSRGSNCFSSTAAVAVSPQAGSVSSASNWWAGPSAAAAAPPSCRAGDN
jgi:hypothetical protein